MKAEAAIVKNIDRSRWLTLFYQMVIGTVTYYTYSLSVYLGPLNEKHGWSIDTLLYIFTISMAISPFANILGGKLSEKYGSRACIVVSGLFYGITIVASGLTDSIWVFVILQGVVASVFMYIVYMAQLSNISTLFPDKQGFVIGLLFAGQSLGCAITPLVSDYLNIHYSVVVSIVVQGTVYGIITVVFGILMVNAPENYCPKNYVIPEVRVQNGEGSIVERDLDWRKAIRFPALYYIILSFAFTLIVGSMLASNGSLMAQDALGIDTTAAAGLVSVFIIGSGIGGIVLGLCADKWGSISATIASTVIGIIFLVATVAVGMNSFYLYGGNMLYQGITYGGYNTLLPLVVMKGYGEKHFGVIYGITGFSFAIASYIGPQMSIWLTGSNSFTVSAAFCALGILTAVLAKRSLNKYYKCNMVK